jgi:hypothetical protein
MNIRIKMCDLSKWKIGGVLSGKIILDKSAIRVTFSNVEGLEENDSVWIPKELKALLTKFRDGENIDIFYYGKSDIQIEGFNDFVEFKIIYPQSKKAA